MVVPDHAFNIKRLDRDDLVLAHQTGRFLVKEVSADVIYLLVDGSHSDTLLCAVGRALLLSGQTSLLAAEPALILRKGLRIGNRVTVAVGVEFLYAHVDADHTAGVWLGNELFLDAERYVILACRSTGHRSIEYAAIRDPGYPGFHSAELRKHYAPIFDAYVIALIAGAVRLAVIVFALVAWVASSPGEEVPVCPVEVAKTLLQSHAVGGCEPQMLRITLQLRQQTGSCDIRQALTTLFPRFASESEEVVIHLE